MVAFRSMRKAIAGNNLVTTCYQRKRNGSAQLPWKKCLFLVSFFHVVHEGHSMKGPNGYALHSSKPEHLSVFPPIVWDDDDGEDSSSEEYESWTPLPDEAKHQLQPPRGENGNVTSNERLSQSPLKTLEKLQQMLDDSDYMTVKSGKASDPEIPTALDQSQHSKPEPKQERLWTSADRSKYKQQQKRLKHKHPPTPDDDLSDTDDGLGYSLPNLPVYLSDGEGDSDVEDQVHPQTESPHPPHPGPSFQQQHLYHQPPQQQQPSPTQGVGLQTDPAAGYGYLPYQNPQFPAPLSPPDLYGPQQQPIQQQYSQAPPYLGPNLHPPNVYGSYPYAPGQFGTPQGPASPAQQQQQAYSQQFVAWATAMGYPPPPFYGPQPPQPWTRPPPLTVPKGPTSAMNIQSTQSQPLPNKNQVAVANHKTMAVYRPPTRQPWNQFAVTIAPNRRQSLAEMSSRISFDSIQKVSLMMVTAAMACYAAVSPRKLPQVEYNALFYDNVRILAFILIAPIITFFSVLDAAENDLNQLILSLYTSFSIGYILAFGLEILFTTIVRLSVFLLLEPDVFDLVPKIPLLTLPWVLRENKYRPKRITLFAADFLTSCVACPILEEYIKLKILQWTSRLPKNYVWARKAKTSGSKKRNKREKVVRNPGEREVTNVNKYVSQMLAVSIGLKLADAGRRVLMYTKPHHADKSFYAICRGIFPVQELCGVMTALRLAKRDVLGTERSTLWILAPAVIVHGMANFRGMKPIFKWNSATPWSEMQLSPWSVADPSTFPQLATKGFSKLMWLIILMRVLGYCAKNYYYTNRQAEKRTTTYAGNPSAVDGALASSDLLKNSK